MVENDPKIYKVLILKIKLLRTFDFPSNSKYPKKGKKDLKTHTQTQSLLGKPEKVEHRSNESRIYKKNVHVCMCMHVFSGLHLFAPIEAPLKTKRYFSNLL